MKVVLTILLLLAVVDCSLACESLAKRLVYRGVAINDPEMITWCSTPIHDGDRFHLFVSRWPSRLKVDPGWRSDSEIAHFVAAKPTGPFTFHDVALKGTRKENSWERFAPHNPLILRVADRFALVYIARSDPKINDTQRIGIATSKSLDGPWQRGNRPVLSPAKDAAHWTFKSRCGVTNPALVQMPDGRFFLYFKAIAHGAKSTTMGLAISRDLLGPYEMQRDPVTANDQAIEDGFAYVGADRRVHLITTDNHGILERGGGLHWVSDDGVHFDAPKVAFHRLDHYVNRTDYLKARVLYGGDWKLERPQFLVVDGEPRWMFAPSGVSLDGDAATECHVLEVMPATE